MMSQNYYKVIDGHKFDNEMIMLADQAVAGQGDGRISLKDAKLLLAGVKDANKYTDIEKATMHYIRDHYRFTPAADKWFRTQIRSWAAIRGWAGHSADEGKVAAEAHGAEPATVVSGPPYTGTVDESEAREEAPPPLIDPAQESPAPPEPEAARPGSRPKWLIPLAVGGAFLAAIAMVVFWPSPPTTVDAPVQDAPQSPVQAETAVPSPTTVDAPVQDAPQSPVQAEAAVPSSAEAARNEPPAEPVATEQQAQAVAKATAEVETASVAQQIPAQSTATSAAASGTHRVNPGDSLWKIAAKWYGDAGLWPRIYRANQKRISNPDIIHPEARITVPGAAAATHRVNPGDSLWKIAAKWYGDAGLWPRIYRANQ
ncbi:MAG: LysM peptidoglycan-binding domain-containing protein, partial [SAR324 cluster bacterium]|nr:LysM peptidoglycan-binding domain-containing protein [SAR324 cluster bacterium]